VNDRRTSVGRSLGDSPALRRCIAGDLDRFAAEHWGARALLSRASDLPAGFDDLLTLDAVDELLSRRGLRTPFLRIAKDGGVVGDGDFTGGGGVGAEVSDQVQDDKVAGLFAAGHTVVLQGLHRVWPPLIDFATELAAEAGHPVQINAYVTPPDSRGFAAHYDVHDVFVLQVAGEKHWTVHAPVHPDPLRDQPWTEHRAAVESAAREAAPVVDEVLRPGDALYLPRGFLHSATALGGVSAHLTVGLHTLTRYLLVQELAALAGSEPALRAALPLGIDPADPDQLAPHLAQVRELLTDHLGSVTPDALAARIRRRTWSANRPAPVGPLAQAEAARDVRVGDVVRLRSGLKHRVVPGDPVRLLLPDRTISLPAATAEALGRLCSGADVVVGDLPVLDEADQLVLVRRLLRESVLTRTKR
jgi:bifunctional lysine-specific demethylase and histidyl-hydroxylase NO66